MFKDDEAERRLREQSAPKLATTIPYVKGLMLEVEEHSQIACVKYKKRFHVESAPMLFELRCNDERCEHGGYNLTHEIARVLRARVARSHGDVTCDGMTGKAFCGRRIHYELFAEYQPG